MRLHNSYTNQIEDFKTIDENKVKMYVCGPTVYDNAHLGHARCYITWDVLYRYLKFKGYDVTYCRNVTDVDDKIIKKANEEGVSTFWYQRFSESMKALNNLKPDIEPFATKTLGEMISIVKDLINKGYAYEANGDVYFRVKKFPQYGYLSKQPIDQLESGARIEVGEQKEDPLDFALWKKDEKFGYKSPWGVGRPGWHIECSVMSKKYLGDEIDIHAGGEDLIFPHHENEIAQSEAANDKPFAKYWMHNAFLNIDNKKMSKSLGNFFTVRDISKEYDLQVLRFFMLSAHYRNPINFSHDLMEAAKNGLDRIITAVTNLTHLEKSAKDSAMTEDEKKVIDSTKDIYGKFEAAMDDDFNTADAISAVFELVKLANSNSSEDNTKEYITALKESIVTLADILGLKVIKEEELLDEDIEALIAERQQARKDKNFARADEIRDELMAKGIILEDTREGVRWKRA